MKTTHLFTVCIAMMSFCAFGQLNNTNKAVMGNVKFPGWYTDLEVAKADATAQNKVITDNAKEGETPPRKLIYLCIFDGNGRNAEDTRNRLFSKPKFKQFAQDNFVLCVLDVTLAKNMDQKTTDQIIEIRKKWNVADNAIPQILVLNQGGGLIQRMEFFVDKTPTELDYLASLRDFLSKRNIVLNEEALRGHKPNKPAPGPTGGKTADKPAPTKQPSAFEKLKQDREKNN